MRTYSFQPAIIARTLILSTLFVIISLAVKAQTFPDGIDIIQSETGQTYSFAYPVNIGTDLLPNSVHIADLDGDGKPDLATPNNYVTNNVSSFSLLRNIGTDNIPAFADKYDVQHAAMTSALGIADFNGDGKPDIVVTSIVDANISIFKNASTPGTFSFSKVVSYATGATSYFISIADFDKDNKPDIVVCNYLSNSVSVYRNTSSGNNISFAAKVDLTTELAPRHIVTGDLDGDGFPEIVAVNELSNSISIFKNNSTTGNISFAARINYATGAKPHSVAMGDIDGDGKQDIVVSNQNENKLTGYKNTSSTGTINLSAPINILTPAGSSHLAIGDLNGDGKPEIISRGLNVEIFQNNSTPGAFTFKPTVYISVNNTMNYLAIGDLTNDGKPELLGVTAVLNKIAIFKNKNNEPAIISFSPNTVVAGEEIEIKGLNFKNISQVTIGGTQVQSFTVVDEFTIKAIVPATISGDIVIKNNHGSGTVSGFVYAGPPTITSFGPVAAAQAGEVIITGTNLSSVTEVSIGGIVMDNFTITSPTTIAVYVNPSASGTIAVKNPYGSASANGFILLPTIASFFPVSAGTGKIVTIQGGNFSAVDAVSFGDEPAQSFEIISSSEIQAVVGNGKSGSIKLFVNGNAVAKAGFTYIAPPTITKVTPLKAAANTTITIEGTNFDNATSVTFGNKTVSFTVISSTSISALITNGSSGDVKIIAPGGTVSVPGFVFVPEPTITNFYPKKAGKGTVVTIIGTLFDEVSAVRFGSSAAASFTVHSADSITAIVGDGETGLLEIIAFGGNALGSSFSYTTTPIIYKVNPLAGEVGSVVNISGGNFSAGASVYFGAVKAKVISGNNNTLQVQVPKGAAYGNITVVNNGRSCYSPLAFTPTFGDGSATVSFAGKADLIAAGNTKYVAIGDFDGDGKPDIASANGSAKSISIYRNRSTVNSLAFASKIDLLSDGEPYIVASADIDGDGKPDIVSINYKEGNYHGIVYRNTSVTSNISFAEGYTFWTDFYPSDLVIADLSGDGKLDIAIQNINVTLNDKTYFTIITNKSAAGNLDLTQYHKVYVPNDSYYYDYVPINMTVGDLDADGNPDLGILTKNGYNRYITYVLKSWGTGIHYDSQPVDMEQIERTVINRAITNGDFNADGLPDFLSTNGVIRNNGNLSFDFLPIEDGTTSLAANLPIADFNGDGKPDFAKILDNDIAVYINSGNAGNIGFETAVNCNTGIAHQDAIAADLDGDGKPEIITANNDETISILKNTTGVVETVTAPQIIEISPAYGSTGTTVKIIGANFNNITSVKLGGVPASSFTVNSPDTITAVVSSGSSGEVEVINEEGNGYLAGFIFVQVPTITAELSTTFCEGDSARLISSSPVNNQWYKNGEAIANANGAVFKVFESGNYAVAFKAGEFVSPLSNVLEINVRKCEAPTDTTIINEPTDTTVVNNPPQLVRLAPNPVTGSSMKVKFDVSLATHVDIEIVDSRGQIILVVPSVANDDYLNLVPLRQGAYYLRIKSKNGKIKTTSRIIKM